MRYFIQILTLLLIFSITALSGCGTPRPLMHIPPTEPSSAYLYQSSPRVVLVLSSGGARGFAHAGVIKALEKNHIPIDMIIGTSAGSIIGALYADHPSASDLTDLLLKTPSGQVIDFSLANLLNGPITGNGLQEFILQNVHARSFEKLKIPFIAVATDLNTGKPHAFGSGPIAPAVNASSAMPLFFSSVNLYGKTYVDGGIADPVPVDIAKRFHPKIIIAVNLNFLLPGVLPTNGPGTLLRSFNIMLMQLQNRTAKGADILIQPSPSEDIGIFDGSKRAVLMQIGERATEKAMPAIRALLIKNHIAVT